MIKPVPHPLYVVTVVSNPCRYRRRYELYHPFAKRVEDSGAKLITVEVAFGDRHFEITDRDNPYHIQLRTREELWHKENMINLGIQHLCKLDPGWKYVAWIDADVSFANPNWVHECVHQLQHFDIIQMFQFAHDLGPNEEMINTHTGFAYGYVEGLKTGDPADYCKRMHPGFAWAARREALDLVGGLIDFAILGAGDKHMAMALIGEIEASVKKLASRCGNLSNGYLRELKKWQMLAEKHLRRNIGYMPGSIMHHWHGKKADRRYVERWKVLMDNHYDPTTDLKRDSQGLYRLVDDGTNRFMTLRDEIRAYFRQRSEDSIDLA